MELREGLLSKTAPEGVSGVSGHPIRNGRLGLDPGGKKGRGGGPAAGGEGDGGGAAIAVARSSPAH